LKNVAYKILSTENGDYEGALKLAKTAGGCSVNTSLAANYYLECLDNSKFQNRILTLGSIGQDV
jgi:hypothetical protein